MDSTNPTSERSDPEDELLVSIPRPFWRTLNRLRVFGLGLVVTLYLAYYLLNNLLQSESLTGIQVALVVILVAAVIFATLFRFVLIWFSLKPPLEIFESGIAIQGFKRSWEHVEGCCWAKYSPDSLMVNSYRQQCLIPIPPNQRAAVENALRNADKWQS